jgi:putative transcriptional regulator
MRRWAAAAALLFTFCASAQPSAVILVAKPELADPNFSESVVLVIHAPGGDTLGVILNRPTEVRLADLAPGLPGAAGHAEPLYRGGPVMARVVVALFESASPPAASSFRVLDHTYLSMQPAILESLLRKRGSRFRLFTGFSGWAPGQLESEIARDGWYVLPASDELLFRRDTSGLWRELIERLRSRRAEAAGYT